MQWINGFNSHNKEKKKLKLDLLAMTETERQELTKQIRECLHHKAAEVKLNKILTVEDQASLDTELQNAETTVGNSIVLDLLRTRDNP
jgi:ribosome recycling factor